MVNNSIKYLETIANTLPSEDWNQKPSARPELSGAVATEDQSTYMPLDLSLEVPKIDVLKQEKVNSLIWAFRDVGYIYAQLNPLGTEYEQKYTTIPQIRSGIFEKLTAEEFGLTAADMSGAFYGGNLFDDKKAPLNEILEAYAQKYCSTIGFEYLHIQNKTIRKWFINNIEIDFQKYDLTQLEKKEILDDLIKAEDLDNFLHTNYLGQKRFSLEGCQVLIPCLHYLVNAAFPLHINEIVLGTTHRGRMTILNIILQLPLADIFALFEDRYVADSTENGGDVKYHIGYSMDHQHPDSSLVHVTLLPNASHLESVGPIVEGRTRGIQHRTNDSAKQHAIPVIVHGEAAFSGQGVVAEIFNLAGLNGYTTGGTIHIIINNQVGFTTSTRDAHSTVFATDSAKGFSIPILHVNGDDPIAVLKLMKLAIDFRQTFHKDIIIDIICYRKYGHNEGDDPSFTHPRMYGLISKHPGIASIYRNYCIRNNILTETEANTIKQHFNQQLQEAFDSFHRAPPATTISAYFPHRVSLVDQKLMMANDLGINKEQLSEIAACINTIPDNFQIHEKLERIITTRFDNYRKNGTIDWAFAESLAFGSLLLEGYDVRLSGQDSERGTFSQRHLVWWETNVDEPKYYIPLNHLKTAQRFLTPYDSPLSEYSILGFEFGYALSNPDHLVIWEAQFGDFSNGAQVIIDNYIIASESKWNQRCGLVILLPHGYEGQGPEHSNGHIDRFLQLCAQENILVCNASTPAQYFYLLRRQVKMKVEKPLIVMSPKSLLRHPLAISNATDLLSGHFQYVIDNDEIDRESVKTLVFCSGKIYYDLIPVIKQTAKAKIVLIRIEQLFPFPQYAIEEVFSKYENASQFCWVQEEPQNRGPWTYINNQFQNSLSKPLLYIGRPPSASPATGSLSKFKYEQELILKQVLGLYE